MVSGIHHLTAITRNVQANVDFYNGFLGLRLVKQTGGFEDAEQLHLFYGDSMGSPGSVVTFFVWQHGAAGRVGAGQVSEIAFAVPPASIGDWLQRSLTRGIASSGPTREQGETVLRLRDPDGIVVKLIALDMPATGPLKDPLAPTRIRSATILTEDSKATAAFAGRFGYREIARDGPITRLVSDTDAIDLFQSAGYVPGAPGTGVFDHIAFRAQDLEELRRMEADLRDHEGDTTVHDRKYYVSLYVREPAGTLFEYATDGPGFTVDEAPDRLGTSLQIPPGDLEREADLRIMTPQFALPGEPRLPERDLHFVHRFHLPADPDGSVIVLLHGTGGSEADLMPMAARMSPGTTLLGVRGRSTEEGVTRWFRRFDETTFDQSDIRFEANAFAAFVEDAVAGYGLDRSRMTFMGYSNGANLLGAVLRLHPGTIGSVILLRAVEVLEDPPPSHLTDTRILLVRGSRDASLEQGGKLQEALELTGARVEAHSVEAGHELSPQDVRIAKRWMDANHLAGRVSR
jgi:phospholipase/carboxylesterase